MDQPNFSPRNMQQLVNNALKDPALTTIGLTTTSGNQLSVHAPIELGTESIAFKSEAGDKAGVTIVPFNAVQRLRLS
jgi:hypothetical protein